MLADAAWPSTPVLKPWQNPPTDPATKNRPPAAETGAADFYAANAWKLADTAPRGNHMEAPIPTYLSTAPIVPPRTEAMPVTLLEWKPITKGALRGFARVRLGRALVI